MTLPVDCVNCRECGERKEVKDDKVIVSGDEEVEWIRKSRSEGLPGTLYDYRVP
jgi:hypothetical protein